MFPAEPTAFQWASRYLADATRSPMRPLPRGAWRPSQSLDRGGFDERRLTQGVRGEVGKSTTHGHRALRPGILHIAISLGARRGHSDHLTCAYDRDSRCRDAADCHACLPQRILACDRRAAADMPSAWHDEWHRLPRVGSCVGATTVFPDFGIAMSASPTAPIAGMINDRHVQQPRVHRAASNSLTGAR